MVQRIGNGEKVCIWKDKWLPRPSTFMVQSPPRLLDLSAKVCELIDKDMKRWNLALLANIFEKKDALLIHSLPVSFSNHEDRQVWRGTKNGLFSVKSAYYIQKELEARGMAESSTRKEFCRVWRGIWGLQIPNVEKKNYGELAMIFFPPVQTYTEGKLSKTPYVQYAVKQMKPLFTSSGNVLQPWTSGAWAMLSCKNCLLMVTLFYKL